MTPAALTPDYANSGAPGKRKTDRGRKRGAPVQHGPEGLNVDDKVRAAFRDSVTRYFAVNKTLDITDCYHKCLELHFCDLIINERTGRQEPVLREAHPSIWQFRYWLKQDNDLFALARKRRTPRVYDKDSRAILGTSLDEVAGPGARYQIDATIADIYLVSRFDRRKIVGRPVIYVVIDVFSRMITGLYVGLEGPSWVGAMMALANAASPKPAWCRQFGVEITDADWPSHSLPVALLADRGEMLGPAADTLIQRFGLRLENAAPYRADWKGIVERRFGLTGSNAPIKRFHHNLREIIRAGATPFYRFEIDDDDLVTVRPRLVSVALAPSITIPEWAEEQPREHARTLGRDYQARRAVWPAFAHEETAKGNPPKNQGAAFVASCKKQDSLRT